MAIPITDLSDLDPSDVLQQDELLAQLLQEAAPEIDTKRGPLRDLLLHYSAILSVKNQTEQERLRRSMSLLEVMEDPSLADEETVDRIASNYRVTRTEGSQAAGSIVIVVSILQDVSISSGALFEAQGKTFAVDDVYTARSSSANVSSATDRLLLARGDGNYEFRVNVIATEVGVASQLLKNTPLLPQIPPLNFVTAYAADDFSGGLDTENTEDMLERFVHGMSAKAMSNRINMSSLIREQFPGIIDDSIIGFGDAEMHRDQHSIFPVSLGGRVDWYVRTQLLYQTISVEKTAILAENDTDGYGIWQIEFDRSEQPGLYDVSVRPTTSDLLLGYFPIVSFTRSADIEETNTDILVPDIVSSVEAAFSSYQAIVVRFKDTLTSTVNDEVGVTTRTYQADVRLMPGLDDLQAYVSSRSVRNAAGDVLIKAPIPCFVQLAMTVALEDLSDAPDTAGIVDELTNFVNSYGFSGQLPASAMHEIVHGYLPPRASIVRTDMLGQILYPDDHLRYLHGVELLEIPYDPADMVTKRTTCFFLRPDSVSISFTAAGNV